MLDQKRMNKRFGFRTYTDNRGNIVGYEIGKDKTGQPIHKKWKWERDTKRTVRVHVEEHDRNDQKAVDFLRNSPECYGSPNGTYLADGTQIDYFFKEVTEEGDAEKASKALLIKAEALTKASNVKGQDFIDLCAMIGVFNKPESVMRHRLLDYAQNYSEEFLKLVDDPTRKTRSLVRRALDANVFIKDGPIIKWENKVIGSDEDTAVANLLSDEILRTTVSDVVKKLS